MILCCRFENASHLSENKLERIHLLNYLFTDGFTFIYYNKNLSLVHMVLTCLKKNFSNIFVRIRSFITLKYYFF